MRIRGLLSRCLIIRILFYKEVLKQHIHLVAGSISLFGPLTIRVLVPLFFELLRVFIVMDRVLCDEVLLSPSHDVIDICHGLIKALQVTHMLLSAAIVKGSGREQIVLLRPHVVSFNDFHWEFI
jgi:hypothetical protein